MKDLKKTLDLFTVLNDESKLILVNLLSKKSLKKNDFIVKKGEKIEDFYLLTKGVVRSFVLDKDNKEHTRSLFRPGSTTGCLKGLISNKKAHLHYECLTDCEFYYGNFNEFKKLTEERIDFANQYSILLENIFFLLESKIHDLSVLNASERYLKMRKEYPNIENLINQYHIASYLNISPVQLSRIRKDINSK